MFRIAKCADLADVKSDRLLARPASGSDAKQCLQLTQTAGEVRGLGQTLLQE